MVMRVYRRASSFAANWNASVELIVLCSFPRTAGHLLELGSIVRIYFSRRRGQGGRVSREFLARLRERGGSRIQCGDNAGVVSRNPSFEQERDERNALRFLSAFAFFSAACRSGNGNSNCETEGGSLGSVARSVLESRESSYTLLGWFVRWKIVEIARSFLLRDHSFCRRLASAKRDLAESDFWKKKVR